MFRTSIEEFGCLVWVHKLTDIVTSLDAELIGCLKSYSMWHLYFGLIKQHHNWNKWILCVQILVGFGFNSDEHLEGQLLFGEWLWQQNKAKYHFTKSYNNEKNACFLP